MIKHTIDDYDIELELNVSYDGGEPRSQCFISRQVDGRSHSASLEALSAEGELTCESSGLDADYVHRVPETTIDKIYDWAVANGY